MGPDSPCPPQCPAGWGKMPKWRPATTLDSPTAGRRRRRLRPSIGNGSPPSPSPLPPRPAVPTPPALGPRGPQPPPPPSHRPELPARGRRGRAPHPPRSRPLPVPFSPSLPPGPAGVGERPPEGRGWGRSDDRGLGTWRAAGASDGPGGKMASRGLGAEPSCPPLAPRLPPPPPCQPPPLILLGLRERRERAKGPRRESLPRHPRSPDNVSLWAPLLGPESPTLFPHQSLRVTAVCQRHCIQPHALWFSCSERMVIFQPPVNCLAARLGKVGEVSSA